MKIRHFSALILAVMMLTSLFSACGKNADTASGGSEPATATEINFVDSEHTALFRVVSPEATSSDYGEAISDMIKVFKEKYGAPMKRITDETADEGYCEILVGDTNREASAAARAMLFEETNARADDYIICSVGDDIAVYGLTAESCNAGIKYFYENYFTGGTVAGPIKHAHNTESSAFKALTLNGVSQLSRFNIVRPLYNLSYIVGLQIEELDNYLYSSTGYKFEEAYDTAVSSDGSATLSRTAENEYEIIIGNCDRDGVTAYSTAERDSYEIRIEDKKIYLNGGSPKATAMAVSEFIKKLEQSTAVTVADSVSGDYNTAVSSYDTATYYTLVWGDDFDGDSINTSLWEVQWNHPATYTLPADGRKIYRGSSVYQNNYVQDGCLYLNGIKDDKAYYGGLLRTYQKTYYKYGYLELSALHPKGLGFWNALWIKSNPELFPEHADDTYWVEVDVDECYGDGTWAYGNTFAHKRSGSGVHHVSNHRYANDDRGFYMDFHTYGFEWIDNTHVRFTCDGEVYADYEFTTEAEKEAFSQPAYLMLSLACGTANHGQPTTDPDEWENTNKYITDWVHLYQVDGNVLYKYNTSTRVAEVVAK